MDSGIMCSPAITSGVFAVQVTLRTSSPYKINIFSSLKPLFDGIIASLHYSRTAIDQEIISKVAAILGEKAESIENWMQRKGPWVISGVCPVKKQGERLFWHPSDHLCVAGLLRKEETGSTEKPEMEIIFHFCH